jgi:hypothetical protein
MARAKWALLAVGVIATLAGTGFVAQGGWRSDGPSGQPIAFPHDVHAGTLQIPCMYCHYTADRSPDAGIPSVQTCAGCHMPGTMPGQPAVPVVRPDAPGVQQLAQYWQQGVPIPWVRIHDLPDHVHFPHMMHVNAGLDCQECHGPVETMREVEQVSSLQMGWCIDCHKQRDVRVDCFICHY